MLSVCFGLMLAGEVCFALDMSERTYKGSTGLLHGRSVWNDEVKRT